MKPVLDAHNTHYIKLIYDDDEEKYFLFPLIRDSTTKLWQHKFFIFSKLERVFNIEEQIFTFKNCLQFH